jgi:hypothetical protein
MSTRAFTAPELEQPAGSLLDEVRRQMRSVPSYATSTGIHLLLLLLLLLIPTRRTESRPEEEVLVVEPILDPVEETTPPPNPREAVTPDELIHEISKLTEPVRTRTIDAEARVDVTIPTEEIAVDPLVEPIADTAPGSDSPSESAEPTAIPMGVGRRAAARMGARTSGRRGSIAQISRSLQGIVTGASPGGGGKNLLLVWLLDQSLSMEDDREAAAGVASDIRELLTESGRRHLRTAVVAFGQGVHVLQPPTESPADVAEAMRTVPSDTTGEENACQALSTVAGTMLTPYGGDWVKVVVLMTDENPGDAATPTKSKTEGEPVSRLEATAELLRRTGVRLLVVGRESPFQMSRVRQPYTFPSGRRHIFTADLGPESARIEVPIRQARTRPDHPRGTEVMSGFGVHDFAYLAAASNGAYFILDDADRQKRHRTRRYFAAHPFVYDWEKLDRYKPDLVAPRRYESTLASKGPTAQHLLKLQAFYRKADASVRRWARARPPATLAARREDLRRRLWALTDLLESTEEHLSTDGDLLKSDERRLHANLDLFRCVLLADEMITAARLDAFETYTGSVAGAPDREHWVELRLRPIPDEALIPQRQADFRTSLEDLIRATNHVIRRHANTPWAVCAHWLSKGPERWGHPQELVRKIHKRSSGGGGNKASRPPVDGI